MSFPQKLLVAYHHDVIHTYQLYFPCCIVLKMDFTSSILFWTYSFVIFSIQLIFSILLHTQLSKTSNCFLKVSDSVHASYSATLQMVLYDSFLQINSVFKLLVSNFFFSMNAFSAIAILHLTVSILWNDRTQILEMIHLLNLLSIYNDLNLPTLLSWNAHHFRFLHIDFYSIFLSHSVTIIHQL